MTEDGPTRSTAGRSGRFGYLSGLRYDALYRHEEWLRGFLEESTARRTLFCCRFATLGTVVALISALFALAGRPFALALGGVVLVIVATVLWSRLPRIIARERGSFEQPLFDPRTARIWRRRGPDGL